MKNTTQWQIMMEQIINGLFLLCGIVAVGFVLVITIHLVIAGMPAIVQIGAANFLLGTVWQSTASTTEPSYGILPFILTSIYGTAGAVVLGVPIGLLTALYLAKVAPPSLARVVHVAVELLAGIPSVVYGLAGMIILVPAIQQMFELSSGATLMAAKVRFTKVFIFTRSIYHFTI